MTAHIFLAHFPVALILIGALADLIAVTVRRPELRGFASSLLILGGACVLLSFLTGQSALDGIAARQPSGSMAIEAHQQWGAVGSWVVAASSGLRAMWRKQLDGPRGWALLVAAQVAALIVIGIATSGAAISHG